MNEPKSMFQVALPPRARSSHHRQPLASFERGALEVGGRVDAADDGRSLQDSATSRGWDFIRGSIGILGRCPRAHISTSNPVSSGGTFVRLRLCSMPVASSATILPRIERDSSADPRYRAMAVGVCWHRARTGRLMARQLAFPALGTRVVWQPVQPCWWWG